MNNWLIANDTFLLLMKPDNSIRLIYNNCMLILLMSLSFIFPGLRNAKRKQEYLEGEMKV